MTDAEKKAYAEGYRLALREALHDVAVVHRSHSQDKRVRQAADLIWAKIKHRINLVRSKEFNFNGTKR